MARILYLGSAILRYTEKELWRMTLRKFYLLWDEHLDYHGLKKKEELDLDSVF